MLQYSHVPLPRIAVAFAARVSVLAALLALAPGCVHTQRPGARAPASDAAPVIPFNSNFWSYWSHYWATWLPDHPVYEMIELTAYEDPKDPSQPFIRVFLTERAGRKTQYFYLNDEAETRRSRANSYFRPIDYKRSGVAGGPQNLLVSFSDKDGVPIQWSVSFAPHARLRGHGSGLTPSVHSVGSILLLALRTRTADSHDDRVMFGGVDYASKLAPGDAAPGTRSWYNPDYYSAVLVHGKSNFSWKNGVLSNSWGRTFSKVPAGSRRYRSGPLGPENFIQFDVDRDGGLRGYSHFSRGHSLNFAFDPAIPSLAKARGGEVARFSASFDNHRALMKGRVEVQRSGSDAVTLKWIPTGPPWAVGRDFTSMLRMQETGYELTTGEVRPPA